MHTLSCQFCTLVDMLTNALRLCRQGATLPLQRSHGHSVLGLMAIVPRLSPACDTGLLQSAVEALTGRQPKYVQPHACVLLGVFLGTLICDLTRLFVHNPGPVPGAGNNNSSS